MRLAHPRSTRRHPALVAAIVLLAVLGLIALALISHTEFEPIAPPERVTFDPRSIARGAQLAAVGDCATCHTASQGRPYAGGLALPTPFGAIYSTNITPDRWTGIGAWSELAFRRAMREGVSRDGHQLYPVFPYDHFTRATDDDLRALYAFVMTRTPVAAVAPSNALRFPFGFRPLVAGWNLLYLDRGAWQSDPSRAPNGTGAPTSRSRSGIAADATRAATGSAPKIDRPICRAARPKAGTRRR